MRERDRRTDDPSRPSLCRAAIRRLRVSTFPTILATSILVRSTLVTTPGGIAGILAAFPGSSAGSFVSAGRTQPSSLNAQGFDRSEVALA